jgi:regulation of enolase protein 1 (concanavalin A-like superfamily)
MPILCSAVQNISELRQEGAVAKVVICPSCQSKGSIPDESKAARIRCPKCGEMFDVKAASGGPPSGATKKPGAPAAPRKPAAPKQSAFDDLDSLEPLPPMSNSGSRRPSSGAQSARGVQAGQGEGSGKSPMLFVVVGIGSLAVVLLIGLLIAVLMRGSGDAGVGAPQIAQAAPTPVVVEPVVTPPPATATSTASTPAAPISAEMDHEEIIKRLKDATVFVILKLNGKPVASGSGFVIETGPNNSVIIATNRHVAVADPMHMPVSAETKQSLDVVFRSGLGGEEQLLPAKIIAADLTMEYSTDLAFLLAEGVKKPPKPVNIISKVEATEGMKYIGAGFPLGKSLNGISESKGNPRVTITTGIVGRIHSDEFGQVTMLQVGGSLLPGNSGGPLIEEKTGKLLGVAVASLAVSGLDSVGFIVTADELRHALEGRVGMILVDIKSIDKTSADLAIDAQMIDPKRAIKGVVLKLAPSSEGSVKPASDGSYPPLPNSTSVELKHDPNTLTATGRVQVPLKGEGAAARKVLIQPGYKDSHGLIVYAKPKEYELPEKPGRILPPGELQRKIKALQKKSLAMLGPLVDPDKDCKLTKDEDTSKITIEIPAKIHSLSPELRTRVDKNKTLHNAPFTVTDVEGDFVAGVEVTGDIEPGAALPKDRKGNDIPITYQSGGIILYQDKNNFVRLERASSVIVSSLEPLHWLVIEAVKDGKQAMKGIYVKYPEKDTLLLMIRRKGKLRCAFSPDGGNHLIPFREFVLDLPKKVKIGLTAANISAKPLSVTFESFAVINDTKLLDSLGEGDDPKK